MPHDAGTHSGAAQSDENAVRLETDICRLQHRQELLLKRICPMMGWLVGDVLLHTFQLGWAHAERSVSLLPSKRGRRFPHPAAGVCLQSSHGIGQRHVRREDHEYMDVV